MDVSPMSLQMVVPRANDAAQVQHNLNQQVNVQQSFAELRDKAEMQMKMETVQKKDEAEDGKIKDDPDHRNGQGGYQGSGRQGSEEEEEAPQERMAVDMYRGHNIDISF